MNVNRQDRPVLGIDLGGTKILAAVVDPDGKVLSRSKRKTKSEKGPADVLDRMAACAREAVEEAGLQMSDIASAGVGAPGPLDPIRGIIIDTPNLKFVDVHLKDELESRISVPVFVDNDVNVGTYGELVYGAARGVQDVIGLFVGTGLGGGVIINGRLHHGFSLNGGELGHMILDPDGPVCGCGNRGCLEAFSSRTAIQREIEFAIRAGKSSIIHELVKGDMSQITSSVLKKAFEANDPVVEKVLKTACEYLGIAVGSLLNILSPEVVVLGGGVVEALPELFVKQVRKKAFKIAFPICCKNVRVVASELGDDAVILGAAALGRERLAEAN
ncbi:MAG TPA: ROK family protein [bacterium]|nr:ROK family protein [bacterium]HQL61703.1 ROK family protein [bacterium]